MFRKLREKWRRRLRTRSSHQRGNSALHNSDRHSSAHAANRSQEHNHRAANQNFAHNHRAANQDFENNRHAANQVFEDNLQAVSQGLQRSHRAANQDYEHNYQAASEEAEHIYHTIDDVQLMANLPDILSGCQRRDATVRHGRDRFIHQDNAPSPVLRDRNMQPDIRRSERNSVGVASYHDQGDHGNRRPAFPQGDLSNTRLKAARVSACCAPDYESSRTQGNHGTRSAQNTHKSCGEKEMRFHSVWLNHSEGYQASKSTYTQTGRSLTPLCIQPPVLFTAPVASCTRWLSTERSLHNSSVDHEYCSLGDYATPVRISSTSQPNCHYTQSRCCRCLTVGAQEASQPMALLRHNRDVISTSQHRKNDANEKGMALKRRQNDSAGTDDTKASFQRLQSGSVGSYDRIKQRSNGNKITQTSLVESDSRRFVRDSAAVPLMPNHVADAFCRYLREKSAAPRAAMVGPTVHASRFDARAKNEINAGQNSGHRLDLSPGRASTDLH